MAELEPGAIAPTFTLLDETRKSVSLADFPSEKVVVYFYPAAMTPGCTLEAIDFNAAANDLAKAGYRVLGISPDAPEKQAGFKEMHNLSFPLLSDADKQVSIAWGAWDTKVLYGKRISGIIRSTFVVEVDLGGIATIELAQYNVRAKGHVDRLRKQLGI